MIMKDAFVRYRTDNACVYSEEGFCESGIVLTSMHAGSMKTPGMVRKWVSRELGVCLSQMWARGQVGWDAARNGRCLAPARVVRRDRTLEDLMVAQGAPFACSSVADTG